MENLQEVFSERIHFRGSLEYALKRASDGEILQKGIVQNTVVTGGRSWILDNIRSAGAASAQVLNNIAVGSGTTAPATSETALVGELDRNTINSWDTTNLTSTTPNMAAIVSFNTNEANGTLGEAAFFNSSSGGTMLNRVTFATQEKATSNTFHITFTVSG